MNNTKDDDCDRIHELWKEAHPHEIMSQSTLAEIGKHVIRILAVVNICREVIIITLHTFAFYTMEYH